MGENLIEPVWAMCLVASIVTGHPSKGLENRRAVF